VNPGVHPPQWAADKSCCIGNRFFPAHRWEQSQFSIDSRLMSSYFFQPLHKLRLFLVRLWLMPALHANRRIPIQTTIRIIFHRQIRLPMDVWPWRLHREINNWRAGWDFRQIHWTILRISFLLPLRLFKFVGVFWFGAGRRTGTP
jgi:hypothetical protein